MGQAGAMGSWRSQGAQDAHSAPGPESSRKGEDLGEPECPTPKKKPLLPSCNNYWLSLWCPENRVLVEPHPGAFLSREPRA